jgi:hypothetical protein
MTLAFLLDEVRCREIPNSHVIRDWASVFGLTYGRLISPVEMR